MTNLTNNLAQTGFMWHSGNASYKFEANGNFKRHALERTYGFPVDLYGISNGKWAFDKNKAILHLQFDNNYQRILQINNINDDGTAFKVPYDGSGEETFIQSPILIDKFK